MAFDPTNGTEGRAHVEVGNTVITGTYDWCIDKNVAAVPVNHFELTADAVDASVSAPVTLYSCSTPNA